MKLKKFYLLQEKLDQYIFENKNKNRKETLKARILAATIELAEIANEVKSFKFWSNKGMDCQKAIEEYVDVLHFLLSIGIDLDACLEESKFLEIDIEFTTLFLKLFDLLAQLNQETTKDNYENVMLYFFTLAKKLEMDDMLIEEEYLRKHEINYERQRNGY